MRDNQLPTGDTNLSSTFTAVPNDRLTAVVQRLWTDEHFLTSFRRDPARAVRRYRLTDEELAVVKSGDEARLTALGADVRMLHTVPPSLAELATGVLRSFPKVAAFLLAAQLTLSGAPARARGLGRERISRPASQTLRARYRRAPGLRRDARALYTVGGRTVHTEPFDL